MKTAVELGIGDRIADSIRLAVPQPTEWQRIGDKVKAAFVLRGPHFVNMHQCEDRSYNTHTPDKKLSARTVAFVLYCHAILGYPCERKRGNQGGNCSN
jgi:hypothetical protein